MSLWGSVCSIASSFASSFLGSSSSGSSGYERGGSYSSSTSATTTNYDPDKVEVAKLENERVHLVKEAQLELLEVNARLEAVMIEARCKGFQAMQVSMLNMLKEVNILAEERFALLENGSHAQIQKVEEMYASLSQDIKNDKFMFEKVPQMLNLANQFPEGSDSRKLYMGGVDREMATHFDFTTEQLKKLNERSQAVISSVIESKAKMQAHIDTVVTKRIEHIEQVIKSNVELPLQDATLQLNLDTSKVPQLESKAEK